MNKTIPYEKLSKKKKRERDAQRRTTWGALNPVTRKPDYSKAYNRRKARQWNRDDYPPRPLCVYAQISMLSVSSPMTDPVTSPTASAGSRNAPAQPYRCSPHRASQEKR